VLLQDVDRVVQRGAHLGGDQFFGRCHQLVDGDGHVGEKSHVAVGEDADQPVAVLGDGHARDVVLAHDRFGVADRGVGRQGDGVDDHARLAALDLVHLLGLVLRRQVAVQHAHAALPRQGDGQLRLSDGVHGCRKEGDVELDAGRKGHAQVRV